MQLFKIKPKRKNPATLLFSAKPKVGKTTKLAEKENNLIINLEKNGSDFLKDIDVISCTDILVAPAKDIKELLLLDTKTKVLDLGDIENPIVRIQSLNRILTALIVLGKPYDFVSIDTITQADMDAEWMGTDHYMDSLQGKTWNRVKDTSIPSDKWDRLFYGDKDYQSVIEIGQNGWRWSRAVMTDLLNLSRSASKKCTIYSTHVKEKMLSKPDKGEVYIKDIALTGAVADIYARNVDAIATVTREDEGDMIINFKGNEDRTGGNRGVIGDYEGPFEWDKIFVDEAPDDKDDKSTTNIETKSKPKPMQKLKTTQVKQETA